MPFPYDSFISSSHIKTESDFAIWLGTTTVGFIRVLGPFTFSMQSFAVFLIPQKRSVLCGMAVFLLDGGTFLSICGCSW